LPERDGACYSPQMASSNKTPELVLYFKPTCPYCTRVLRAIEEIRLTHPLKVKTRDVAADSQAKDHLLEVGGKATVPCLFIDGKPLYESSDIVAYLRSRTD
jgi:glutaredoxin 3